MCEVKRKKMKELHKKIVSLLSMLALLFAVSAPVYGGGENPWDSDGSSGSQDEFIPGPGEGGSGAQAPVTTVAVGSEGIVTSAGEWLYFYLLNILDMGNAKADSPAVKTETRTQSKGL